MRRAGLLLLGLALVLLVGRIGLGFLHAPDDQRLVREALAEATKAAREGRAGGVLDNISAEVALNGERPPNLSGVADVVRRYSPDVKLASTAAAVTGDEARVVTPAELSVGVGPLRTAFPLGQITIVLRKEPDHDFLIIPTHRWRVTRIEVPQTTASDLAAKIGALGGDSGGGFGGFGG